MKKLLHILIVVGCGAIGILLITMIIRRLQRVSTDQNLVKTTVPQKRVVWINVFVHGTFGTTMGMLSLQSLLKDEVRGTAYRGVNKEMRDNPIFFQTQPILKRGLHAIDPSFARQEGIDYSYAAYPIAKAFDSFLQATFQGEFEQKYYTFGWSGLISQHRRRFEAIRFFNALQEEISVLKKQNIDPRIRVLAHSHGGNLCLNLGAIDVILKAKTLSMLHKYSLDPATDESIKKMLEIMKMLEPKESAVARTDMQKKLDYVPTEKDMCIDELVLLGTPIQAETEHFLMAPIFKTIYNVYSDQDEVQRLDWVSTRGKASKQRIDESLVQQCIKNKNITTRIVQVRIMYERDVVRAQDNHLHIIHAGEQKASLVDQLLGAAVKGKDPDHRALWFVGFDKNQPVETQSYILPLPTLVFIPSIIALIARQKTCDDIDINLVVQDSWIKLFLMKHQDDKVLDTLAIQKALFDEIKQKLMAWAPSKEVSKKEFDAVYQYITHLKPQADKPLQKES